MVASLDGEKTWKTRLLGRSMSLDRCFSKTRNIYEDDKHATW